ncbi:SLC13 family permease [Mariniluteicoccus endophyticus]
MGPQVLSLLVLVAVFLIATVRSVNMGALALVAAALVGTNVFHMTISKVLGQFPASLFVILVGVTYLFALAKNNGTVDWIVHAAVRAVRGRVVLIPWAMFVVCAVITAFGAVSPAAVAIVAPIALGFAVRYQIHPVLMGMMVVQGATAGSFSPMGIFGSITNGVVAKSHLPGNPTILFVVTFLGSLLCAFVVFLAFGGLRLAKAGPASEADLDAGVEPAGSYTRAAVSGTVESVVEGVERTRSPGHWTGGSHAEADDTHRLNLERILTLVGLVGLALGALVLKLDVGITALAIAVALTLVFPASAKGAVDKIAWGTVLLIGGIVTYVGVLETNGVVKWMGDEVAHLSTPLVVALLICLIGAVVSAFASTTGILGALIPLAVPFLSTGQVGAVGLICALALSSSVVDCSPFSTNGALVVANSEASERDITFKRLMQWGMGIMVVAPIVCWAALVLPGWL